MTQHLLPQCTCGSSGAAGIVVHNIPILECTQCGVMRQLVTMTPTQVADWYREKYLAEAYYHTFEHDLLVAKKRLTAYRLTAGVKILDVGCGNGAFVQAARAAGLDAWGQELSKDSDSDFIYAGQQLEDVAFPTDNFDVITLHDVLEHLPRPLDTLREVRRILKRPGKLIVDFPRFHHESGVHHWKAVEHLWMFTEDQLRELLVAAGFQVTAVSYPIPSKVVLEAEKVAEKRPQILVPPGIGDSLWSITKLPGFLREHGLGLPDVWVQDSGGPRRTQPFLRTINFINAAGYKQLSDRSPVFHEAYMQNRRTVFADIADTDYFIAYNGVMRYGRSLQEVDPQYGCEWRPKMHISKEALKMKERLAGPGDYILTYWAEAGMYQHWLQEFPVAKIVESLRIIQETLGVRLVFMGAPWDRGQIGKVIAGSDADWEDLIGATTFDQMLGAILGAKAVVGYPAGNTILATVFNVPTVLLWNRYFHEGFWKHSCPPDSPYTVLNTNGLEPRAFRRAVQQTLEHGRDYPRTH